MQNDFTFSVFFIRKEIEKLLKEPFEQLHVKGKFNFDNQNSSFYDIEAEGFSGKVYRTEDAPSSTPKTSNAEASPKAEGALAEAKFASPATLTDTRVFGCPRPCPV